ncbi:MAG: pilus assembly protein CpaE [Lapillicoccus sp.]
MLDIPLAQQLQAAGLAWEPTAGDRFVLPIESMSQEIFILSNVIADIHRFEGGNVIGFNGTTEWALDSVDQSEVVWLPREDQLRDLLGPAFVLLEQVPGGYAVTATARGGIEQRYVDIDAERAYARAVLARLGVPTAEV